MQMMNDKFNDSKVATNIRGFLGEKDADYLPQSVTLNEYLKRMEPTQLQGIIQDEVYELIEEKVLMKPNFRRNG